MKINTDSMLEIGSSHDICEDYILHGITENNIPYIILSDGCSSSKYTDVGARILTHKVKKYINNHLCYLNESIFLEKTYDYLPINIIYEANHIIEELNLPQSCLDCTLLFMFIIEGKCYIYRYGDGSVIIEFTDNTIQINSVQFMKNNPYYMSYLLNPKLNEDYFENIGENYLNKVYTLKDENNVVLCDFKDSLVDINKRSVQAIDLKDVKNILISSDGIDSFLDKTNGENTPAEELIYHILNFKNLNGNFLKRTLKSKKGVFNQLRKQNIINFDDISIGCFNIQHEDIN